MRLAGILVLMVAQQAGAAAPYTLSCGADVTRVFSDKTEAVEIESNNAGRRYYKFAYQADPGGRKANAKALSL